MPLTNGCCNDPDWPTTLFVAVSVRPYQLCVLCTPSVAIVPTCCKVKQLIQIWNIWGHSVPTFIKIAQVLKDILRKSFWSLFLDTLY